MTRDEAILKVQEMEKCAAKAMGYKDVDAAAVCASLANAYARIAASTPPTSRLPKPPTRDPANP